MQAKQNKRVPHALLFTGTCDLEKKLFADVLAKAMLCQQPSAQGEACGTCHACHLFNAKSHPDFMLIEPEQAGQMIKIDQIRGVVHFVNETAMQGGFRVIIIQPAHAMNISAANALLKTLEEPTPNTLLILISDQSMRLSATITSRCQKLVFAKPPRDQAFAWLHSQGIAENMRELLLNLAEGAPLKAAALAAESAMTLRQTIYQGLHALSRGQADPLQLAAQWHEQDVLAILKLMLSWLRDMLRLTLTQGQVELLNSDYRDVFTDIIKKITRDSLLLYLEKVQHSYLKLAGLPNLNKQLLLEELLIGWVNYESR